MILVGFIHSSTGHTVLMNPEKVCQVFDEGDGSCRVFLEHSSLPVPVVGSYEEVCTRLTDDYGSCGDVFIKGKRVHGKGCTAG